MVFYIQLEAVWTPSLQSLSALGWLLDLSLWGRNDLGLFYEVLAETGVGSSPIKNLSINPFWKEQKPVPAKYRQDIMVKVIKKTIKGSVRGKWQGNIKTTVVCDEKVVIQIIDKVSYHRKAFAFHIKVQIIAWVLGVITKFAMFCKLA